MHVRMPTYTNKVNGRAAQFPRFRAACLSSIFCKNRGQKFTMLQSTRTQPRGNPSLRKNSFFGVLFLDLGILVWGWGGLLALQPFCLLPPLRAADMAGALHPGHLPALGRLGTAVLSTTCYCQVNVDQYVAKDVEKIVYKEVKVPIEVKKEVIVKQEVEVPVEKVIERIRKVPVERVIEKVVEKVWSCAPSKEGRLGRPGTQRMWRNKMWLFFGS